MPEERERLNRLRGTWNRKIRDVAEFVVIDGFHRIALVARKLLGADLKNAVERVRAGDPEMRDRARTILDEAVACGDLSASERLIVEKAFTEAVAVECGRYSRGIGRDKNRSMMLQVSKGVDASLRLRIGSWLKLLAEKHDEADNIETQIEALEALRAGIDVEINTLTSDPHLAAAVERSKKLARDLPHPPLKTATNVEVAAMGLAHYYVYVFTTYVGDAFNSSDEYIKEAIKREQTLGEAMKATGDDSLRKQTDYYADLVALACADNDEDRKELIDFLVLWRNNAYARLEIGHKLAAALCLTDVREHDSSVKFPWPAFSLVVPDGLIDNIARVWVDSEHHTIRIIERSGKRWGGSSETVKRMITNLTVGVALAMSDPDEFRKEKHHGATHAPGSSKNRRSGAPDFDQARYMLSAPVKVDLRPHVLEAIAAEREGRRHSSPTVQFLVMGHWRNQACGVGNTERKRIWIQPFWKGPEESRVLLRTYVVEEKNVGK